MQGSSDPNRHLLDAAALCSHLVAPNTVAAFLAQHRSELFSDELFADLFPSSTGRPSVPADVVATVMVLQALEGLTDRDAIQQLRTNIAWKVATGLALDDEGFHPTVLTLWRNRLRTSDRPQRIFEAVRAVVQATGVLALRQRRALDSTVLDDAVTRQDTVTQLVAQIRVVRRLVPQARALDLSAHDYESPARKPVCAWNDQADIDRVVTALVTWMRSTTRRAALSASRCRGAAAWAEGARQATWRSAPSAPHHRITGPPTIRCRSGRAPAPTSGRWRSCSAQLKLANRPPSASTVPRSVDEAAARTILPMSSTPPTSPGVSLSTESVAALNATMI